MFKIAVFLFLAVSGHGAAELQNLSTPSALKAGQNFTVSFQMKVGSLQKAEYMVYLLHDTGPSAPPCLQGGHVLASMSGVADVLESRNSFFAILSSQEGGVFAFTEGLIPEFHDISVSLFSPSAKVFPAMRVWVVGKDVLLGSGDWECGEQDAFLTQAVVFAQQEVFDETEEDFYQEEFQ